MSRTQCDKGARIEREIVHRHRNLGILAERVPLSGAMHYQGRSHDVDLYLDGPNCHPWKAEVKARGGGGGFTQLERWLGDHDLLILRRDRAEPLIILPWTIWARLIWDRIANRPAIAFSESPAGVVDIPPLDTGERPEGLHRASESDCESFDESGVARV